MPHNPTHSLLTPVAPRGEPTRDGQRSSMTARPGAPLQGHVSNLSGGQSAMRPATPAFSSAHQPQAMQRPPLQPQPHAGIAKPAGAGNPPPTMAPPVDPGQRIIPEPPVAQPDDGAWANMRDSSVFLRANRHSSRVRLLRIALPVIAVLIIAGIAGAYILSQANLPQVTIANTAFENGRMVMRNPVLDGVDGKQQPYRLTAREAVQDPKQPRQVELDSISAEVPVQQGIYAHILAGTGFYDGDAKRLDLGGDIEVVTDDGMTAKLRDAAVDIGAGTLKTDNPIAMTTEQAEISAESMFVEDNGAKVVFENRVKMTIFPGKIQALQNAASDESGEGSSQ